MYIALKWLTGLALAMWLAMCFIDFRIKQNKEIGMRELKKDPLWWTYENISILQEEEPESQEIHSGKLYIKKYRRYDPVILHYAMFFSGAFVVSVFNKKKEIISYTKDAIARLDFTKISNKFRNCLKQTVTILYVATLKYSTVLWVISKKIVSKIKNIKWGNSDVKEKSMRLNLILLNKFKEMAEERKKLGRLLITAINENKHIRTQYHLENMAKNRLVRHVEETQKTIKENRSKYVSFQHLYLVTHQENIFLKDRIRKLTIEKENAEKDLMKIINEVYKSKNNDLKLFCSRLIVRPIDNLMNSDVNIEVQKFLQKSYYSAEVSSTWQVASTVDLAAKTENQLFSCHNNHLVPFVSDAPKLKGLPGECIWTVKDKDGIIEKLYEYDYGTDFDNGDTIRRIREYSVYHDKDCLLDFSSSRTVVAKSVEPTSKRFLTGSEAFKKFLQDNNNIVPSSRSSVPTLLY